jgi:AcrR family transcriptional regulator
MGGKTMKSRKQLASLEGHRGYQPPRYRRAGATADALLQSGRRLLRAVPLEGMTIQDLCARADVTTGAFYGRFESKEAFFKALQSLALQDIQEGTVVRLAELDAREWTLEDAVHIVVRNLRRWILRHEGVLRASLARGTGASASWAPFRRGGQDFVDQLAPRVERMLDGASSEARTLRIRFAFQIVISTLVNAAINRPEPLALTDARTDQELTRAFCAYVRAA